MTDEAKIIVLECEIKYLMQELHDARIENSAQAALLERARQHRPEPSRLEIAAMILAANLSREKYQWDMEGEAGWALEQADALIAAAKETK